MVTNGGYGGMQLALAHGIPLVVAGTAEDKLDFGARVQRSGTGIRIRRDKPRQRAIRHAVHRLLDGASFRETAARHQEHARDYSGGNAAVDIIEEVIATQARVTWS